MGTIFVRSLSKGVLLVVWGIIAGLITWLTPEVAQGQFATDSLGLGIADEIVLDQIRPTPGTVVTATLNDYSSGITGPQVTWRLDGVLIETATNRRQIEVVAGTVGTPQTLTATLTRGSGTEQTLTASFIPTYTDIVVEPQTRVPDWYAGRGLPSFSSVVNVTAIVNDGSFIDPATHVYEWRVGQQVLEGGAVRGRHKTSFLTPRGGRVAVTVTVSTLNGVVVGKAGKMVEIGEPELLFYEQHSLYGLQQTPLRPEQTVIGNTMTVRAEPFNLDIRVYNNPDVSEWQINSQTTSNNTQNPYLITLRQPAGQRRVSLGFHVRSLQQVLQGDEEQLILRF